MKNFIKLILQKILGFKNYLFIFSIFKIYTLRFDKKESDFIALLKFLKEDDVILDIGANIGIMTVLLANKCKKGRVYAFEPIDENYNALRRVIRFFNLKNVTAYQVALGDKNEVVKMILPTLHSLKLQGLSHVIDDNTKESGKLYSIEQITLDSLWKNEKHKITAIKIDVENYENIVFNGAINTLKANKPIIYAELWDNENRVRSFNLLKSLGYNIKIYKHNSFIEFQKSGSECDNFFFFPETGQQFFEDKFS